METEVVEDKKKAKLCDDCGHASAVHELEGAGRCTASGCRCLGPVEAEDANQMDSDDPV